MIFATRLGPSLVLALLLVGTAVAPASAQTIVTLGSGFRNPTGVAVDAVGNLFVADPGHPFTDGDPRDSQVKEILAAGQYLSVDPLGTGFTDSQGVAVDASGNLFICDSGHGAIKEVLAAGGYTTIKTLVSGLGLIPTAIAIDGAGNLYVSEPLSGALVEFLATGGYATVKTVVPAGLFNVQGLAVDAAGDIFIPDALDSLVLEIPAAGGYAAVKTLGSGFVGPGAVAIDAGGNVFVADEGNEAVKEILAAGGYTTVQTLATGFNFMTGIAVDSHGNLFVSQGGQPGVAGAVTEILAAGGYATQTPVGSGFKAPLSLALDANGNLFFCDGGHSAIKEVLAAGGYTTVNTLVEGFYVPAGTAVDSSGNVFVADQGDSEVKEILAAGGYTVVKTIGSGFGEPTAIALDAQGNVYITDAADDAVKEILAAGGYTTVNTLTTAVPDPTGIAVDSAGDVFVASESFNPVPNPSSVVELVAVGGSIPSSPTITPIAGGFAGAPGLAVDGAGNLFVADQGNSAVKEILAAGGYVTVTTLGSGFNQPQGVAVDISGNVFVADSGNGVIKEILASPPALLASVLPGSRAVALGSTATIFATMINSGATALDNCRIALAPTAPAGLSLQFQTTNPDTNALTGTPDTPVTIAGNNGLQTFLVAFQGNAGFSAQAMPLDFLCDGAAPAAIIPGVDTIDLTLSSTPVADIIALAATPTGNGIVSLPNGGTGAFAVASINLGVTATLAVSLDTGAALLPVALYVCQTDPTTAQCLAPPATSLSIDYAGGTTPTFSVFLQSNGAIAFAPASSRVFVRFMDADGGLHGSTSVAIETN